MRELVAELALGLREHVLPHLGSHAGRDHLQTGTGGDVTFAIDEEAEAYLERFLAEKAPNVAVAAAPLGDGAPTMADVDVGCVVEIKSGTTFIAERGSGVEIRTADRELRTPDLSSNTDVSRMFWTLGFRGRPALPLIHVLSELIDASSVGGAVFDLGSAAFDLTRLVTGQLDAYLDVGTRMIEAAPSLQTQFEHVGGGAILNNSPYDLAAPVLCLEEAGGVVTDARGDPLAGRLLLGSGHDFQMSCVAAANAQLHERIMSFVERGIARLADRD
jgi:myo-inositol-1(or 4)-monophosphatase